MSNRRKIRPPSANRSRGHRGAGGGSGQQEPLVSFQNVSAADLAAFGFPSMARKVCSECGAPVEWVDQAAAATHGLDVDQARRFLGAHSGEQLDYWICSHCDNSGVLGPASSF